MANVIPGLPPANSPFLPTTNVGDESPNSPLPFDSDEFFIRRTLDQNPEHGVELLYRRYFQPLCTHAVRFVGSRQTAEDIVSEIFYQFYTEQVFEQISTSYRAYLFKTVRNRAYNYLRRELGRKTSLAEAALLSVKK